MTKTILVTGAAGLVGVELTARLAAAGHAVVALTHHRGDLVAHDGKPIRATRWTGPPAPGSVVCVPGDVTRARLGLTGAGYAGLAAEADIVVHSAAITDFGKPAEVYDRVNVEGTRQVLEFAAASSASLVHVSSAYVCGERDGLIGEDEADVGQRFANPYEHSKLRAELLVRAAVADGLTATVVRPSIVVGARRTGAIREYKNIYMLVKLAAEGRLRTLPGRFDALLDLVPVDRAADVIAAAALRLPEVAGSTLHVLGYCVTLGDISAVIAESPSLCVPRFVPSAAFDADSLPALERRYYQSVGTLYESYLRRRARFDETGARRLFPEPLPGGGRGYLRRMIRYCLRTGYIDPGGAPAAARVAEGALR